MKLIKYLIINLASWVYLEINQVVFYFSYSIELISLIICEFLSNLINGRLMFIPSSSALPQKMKVDINWYSKTKAVCSTTIYFTATFHGFPYIPSFPSAICSTTASLLQLVSIEFVFCLRNLFSIEGFILWIFIFVARYEEVWGFDIKKRYNQFPTWSYHR